MAAAQQPEQQQLHPALIEEGFGADTLNVISQEPEAGVQPHLAIRFLVGQAGPGVFLYAKVARLPPELAINLGEHLIKEGQRLKTGLVIAGAGVPADLHG